MTATTTTADAEAVGPRADPTPRSRPRSGKYARSNTVDPSFSLAKHLTQTLGVAGAIAGFGAWLTVGSPAWLWALAPVFWLIANVFEWATHRHPMHKRLWPKTMYWAHTLVHHNAFAGEGADMEIRDVRDLSVVMMPWWTLVIIFTGASPIAVAAYLVGGPGLAGVFLVSAVAYFLLYETIHTLHHLPAAWLQQRAWGRSRLLAYLRRHHHHHHQLSRMSHVNFNVTFPLGDALMGTLERPPADPATH